MDITGPVNTTSDKWLIPEEVFAIVFIVLLTIGAIITIKAVIDESKKNKK